MNFSDSFTSLVFHSVNLPDHSYTRSLLLELSIKVSAIRLAIMENGINKFTERPSNPYLPPITWSLRSFKLCQSLELKGIYRFLPISIPNFIRIIILNLLIRFEFLKIRHTVDLN